MKNKLFTKVLSILLFVVLSVFGFAGCAFMQSETKAISLSETTKELVVGESFTLTATTTPADAEVVWSSSDEAIVTVDKGTVVAVAEGTATVTAKNDTETATCRITVKAEEPENSTKPEDVEKYTVVFKNGETTLKSVELLEGATISYNGVLPSKTATEQYTYTFSGWSLTNGGEVVDISKVTLDENKTFYAVFTESIREYTVTWKVDEKTTTTTVAYGETPVYKEATPTKPTVGNTSYTFLGWATSLSGTALEALPAVNGDVTYYAIFDEVTAQTTFTITWKNGDQVLKVDENVEYDTIPVYTGEIPTMAPTTEIEYVFAGWAPSADGEKLDPMPEVTADSTYYAVFEETARKYEITWVIEGEEFTTMCAYGSVPAYDGTPTKADSSDCSYKFDGWALAAEGEKEETLPVVNGEATYYAVFVVDQVFEAPKFLGGAIMYSVKSEEIFLPEGLLGEGVTLTKAVVKAEGEQDVVAYENDAWVYSVITLTEEEWKENYIGVRTLEVNLSNGERYGIQMKVYAGIIDELSDFPAFFNNTAVPSEFKPEEYPAVAPNTYGYYIVTKDLGSVTMSKVDKQLVYTYSDELALTQTAETDYQKTNGFNGVLDGQGYTLRFKLTSGGLVGRVLGNAVIKNLGVIYEDASFDANDKFNTGHGVFGYVTNGAPEIRNCYIERTNNIDSRSSVLGIMARPNAKLIIHNTVIYGFAAPNDCTWWSSTINCINETSTNVYLIHGRKNAQELTMVKNFTKVYNDAIENGTRSVVLTDIEDATKFDDKYWYKENGSLIWKGLETATITWVNGEEVVYETVSKGSAVAYTKTLPENSTTETGTVEYYWSTTEDGANKVAFSDVFEVVDDITYYMIEKTSVRYYTVTWNVEGVETTTDYEYGQVAEREEPVKEADKCYTYEFKGWALSKNGEVVELGAVTQDGIVYYAVFEKQAKVNLVEVQEAILYSTNDSNIFLPAELNVALDETVTITTMEGDVVYYENGEWKKNFALTEEQIKANAIGEFKVAVEKGTDLYTATVKSYAGVIDELADFPKFFNNDPTVAAPDTFGYYIVTKNLGTGAEELHMTQSQITNYKPTNGFGGVLDGAGHTLNFKLMSGSLLGYYLSTATIKNIAIYFEDKTFAKNGNTPIGGYGIFGFRSMDNTVIDNCYIQQTNNHYEKVTSFGLMARPFGKLTLHNTVVYGFNTNHLNTTWGDSAAINAASTNAYVICGRGGADAYPQAVGFTKVYTNGSGEPYDTNGGTKVVPLADVADPSGFNAYWNKETGISWKGAEDMTFSSVSVATLAE